MLLATTFSAGSFRLRFGLRLQHNGKTTTGKEHAAAVAVGRFCCLLLVASGLLTGEREVGRCTNEYVEHHQRNNGLSSGSAELVSTTDKQLLFYFYV